MKAIASTIILCMVILCVNAQVFQVNQGHCKKKEMEILTGDSIPKGYAIMQMGTFMKEHIEGSIEGLTKKQIRTMKTLCHWRRCCHVFIAFEQIQTFKNYTPGAEYYENKVSFYVLTPMWQVEIIK